eukprot:scaffold13796_cov118-Isochrysis_galbana.AAC.1
MPTNIFILSLELLQAFRHSTVFLLQAPYYVRTHNTEHTAHFACGEDFLSELVCCLPPYCPPPPVPCIVYMYCADAYWRSCSLMFSSRSSARTTHDTATSTCALRKKNSACTWRATMAPRQLPAGAERGRYGRGHGREMSPR